MAVIFPSLVAPMRIRWMVAGRCVVLLNIRGRVSATFTGRPATRAPSAASNTWAQLSAEAAANEGRDDADILLRNAQSLRHVASDPIDDLGRSPEREPVAVPSG